MQKFTDNNIFLKEDVHEYQLHDDPEMEFTSCTTFAKYFFQPFDKIGIANNLTSNNPNYISMTPQLLVEQWDSIAEEGTIIHNEIEQFIKHKVDKPTRVKSKVAIEWIKNNFTDRYEVFSEVIVYSKELALAGSIDILLYDKEEKSYKILDWKTNKKIDTTSYRNRMGNHQASSNLLDCNFFHYSIQLSLYRYILEKHYNIEITGTAISHLTDEKVISYKTNYHKSEIEKMLKADRVALKKKAEDSLTKEFI
ncbi:MAG: PD-(D/E)XK nuclease family protein [Melioribacteraceae bacterium]|nr:PD-(D/E)XK nuclease family protein [Melioribacteraceae bacterium]